MKTGIRKAGIVGLAVIAIILFVCLFKNFGFDLYQIAPGQMEKTLLPGDRLLVNKWSYGLRLPQTPVSIPFCHDTIPGTHIPSWISWIKLPYARLNLSYPERNDILVFNYPSSGNDLIPIERKKIAVARCIGLPGDTITSIEKTLYINGKILTPPPLSLIPILSSDSNETTLLPALKANAISEKYEKIKTDYLRLLTRYELNKLTEYLHTDTLVKPITLKKDNYSVILPMPGEETFITQENIHFLGEILNRYENIQVTIRNNRLYRGNKELQSYIFTQPYYWVLSDNRTSQADSRTFGVLPHSHLIGKGIAIGYSLDDEKTFWKSWRNERFFQKNGL